MLFFVCVSCPRNKQCVWPYNKPSQIVCVSTCIHEGVRNQFPVGQGTSCQVGGYHCWELPNHRNIMAYITQIFNQAGGSLPSVVSNFM